MRQTAVICLVIAATGVARAQSTPKLPAETLLDRAIMTALDAELSGSRRRIKCRGSRNSIACRHRQDFTMRSST
jgi:hypothetical protein